MAYEKTTVPVEKSQAEIRKLLYRYGATNMAFAEALEDDHAWAAIEFVINDARVRIRVPLQVDRADINAQVRRAVTRTRDQITAEAAAQEARRIWRVLFHTLKARLVSVEDNVESFEEAFLAHMVDPVTGVTVWEAVRHYVTAGALKVDGRGIMGEPLRELYTRTAIGPADVVDAEIVE